LALGTGDLDCVYHFALTELQETVQEIGNEDSLGLLRMMVADSATAAIFHSTSHFDPTIDLMM